MYNRVQKKQLGGPVQKSEESAVALVGVVEGIDKVGSNGEVTGNDV